MNRRGVLLGAAVAGTAVVAGGATYAVVGAQRDRALSEADGLAAEAARLRQAAATQEAGAKALQTRVDNLAQRWIASGGGVNRKLMPDAAGQPTVEMLEVFSFDRQHAFCRVDTNPEPFWMPTHTMGTVAIPARSFYMAMASNTIDQFEAKQTPDGKATATLRGFLDCHTEVVTATVTVGSRTAGEPAAYEIVAVDGGPGGGAKGDSFAFTVFFDPQTAPLNFAMFGPRFTFTGDLVAGEITVRNLAGLAS